MRSLLLTLPAAVLALAACTAPGTGPAGDSGGRASPARTGSPQPSPSADRPAPPGCPAGPATITARRRETPLPRCLLPGQTLHISTEPSPLQPWHPLTTSDESVVRCISRPTTDGAVEATCTALRVGTATVSTTTSPYAGDPHGPAQFSWQLPIRVT